ncbi:MAG: hexose kinase [Trebonia sp.]|jgi:tagatose 6-phosphate kinase
MIVVVCLNPALDITHRVPAVNWGGVNRPSLVYARPGGKGLNVARTLHALGAELLLTGLVGGLTGAGIEAELGRLGVPAALTPIAGETRRTFTIADDGGADGGTAVTAFNEAGPEVSGREFAAFRGQYAKALARAEAVVLSGSLPAGLAARTYATLIEMAAAAGVPAVLDTHGEALWHGVAAGPAIVKPNLDELENLAGRLSTAHAAHAAYGGDSGDSPDLAAVTIVADQLRILGAQAVVASLGPHGLLAATGDGRWQARPAQVAGNATGAGDAVAAALAHGLVLGRPWDERLRHAAALGAATVAAPVAGEFSVVDYARALSTVTVRRAAAGRGTTLDRDIALDRDEVS